MGIRHTDDPFICQHLLSFVYFRQNVLRIFVYRIYLFYEFSLLREVTDILFDVFGTHLEISVSTNGMRLDKLTQLQNLRYIDAVHISRHHYDDEINRELFGGADVPGGKQLKEIIGSVTFRDIFVLNCMLLRDYINSPEEAHRFLDFAIDTGAPKGRLYELLRGECVLRSADDTL